MTARFEASYWSRLSLDREANIESHAICSNISLAYDDDQPWRYSTICSG